MRRPGVVVLRGVSLAAALLLVACGSAHRDPTPDQEDQASERADERLSDASFEDVGDTSQCTEDCSGHDAGFEWARDHDVTDASECSGDSQSFVEGCEAYAGAHEQAAEEELESGDDDEDE